MIERRKEARNSVTYPVYFVCLGGGGSFEAQGVATVINISNGGILIEAKNPILTRQIKIVAPLQDKGNLEVYAELIYSINLEKDRYRCGLSFQGDPVQISRFVAGLVGA